MEAGARLDDTGALPLSLTRPRLHHTAGARVVVWEDDRQGGYRIAVARIATGG